MRCFISIDVDDSLVGRISEIQERIKKLDVDVKFVEPENLHFTINFLGDMNKDGINSVKKSLDFLKYEHEFKISIFGIGYFGSQNRVRTLWLGVKDGEDELIKLMKNVNDNVKFGEKIFSPHLTIGRVKSDINKGILLGFIDECRNVNTGEMHVKTVKLKMSSLTGYGPIYSDISVFKLGQVTK
jgi:2'-5' RNA ligase